MLFSHHDERHGRGGGHDQRQQHDERQGHGGRHDQRQQQQQHYHHDDELQGHGGRLDPRQQHRHNQDRQHGRRYHQAMYGDRAHRSNALQWMVAVVFTVLAVAVLLAAVTVLIVVLLVQPRSPYVAVRTAHLDTLVYDQQGVLDDVQVSVLVEARNGNAHSAAGFSDLEVRLAFGGTVLAKLRADPLVVPARGALPLAYVARAQGAPLDATGSADMEAAIRGGVVPLSLEGEARTRWKLAGLVAVRHWTRLACQLRFAWPNGTALDFRCSSKSKSWFF